MPAGKYVYAGAGVWKGVSRPDVITTVDTGFTLGTTMPVWKGTQHPDNNVGVPYGMQGANYAGTINFSNGPVNITEPLNITSNQTVYGSGHRLKNFRLVASYAGDSGGGHLNTLDPSVSDLVIENFEVQPATPGDRFNAIYGHHFIARRGVLTRTVDGVGVYNHLGGGGRGEAALEGCWVGLLAWYEDDYLDSNGNPRPNGHSDGSGSHNDGTQQAGAPGYRVEGCFLQGAKYNVKNPANVVMDANNMEFTLANGNGIDLLDRSVNHKHPQASQAMLSQYTVGLPGIDLEFINNWVWNWDHGIYLQSYHKPTATYKTIYATVKGNKFGGQWRDYGGTHKWYPFRFDTNCVINGRSYTGRSGAYTLNDGNSATDNNRWVGTAGLGDNVAITYRVDSVAAAS